MFARLVARAATGVGCTLHLLSRPVCPACGPVVWRWWHDLVTHPGESDL